MKKIFKFVRDKQESINCGEATYDSVAGSIASAVTTSKSDRLVPDGGPVIDIVKDFKWTKTKRNSVGRQGTPTIELQEFYVPLPAFFSNLNTVKQLATTAGKGIGAIIDQVVNIAGAGESQASAVKKTAQEVNKSTEAWLQEARKRFGAEEMTFPNYLKAYENLYGVKRSNFIYKLPYFEDSYKEVTSSWEDAPGLSSTLTDGAKSLTDMIGSLTAPAVGIDFSKSFQYGGSEPSHQISFFLDNTKDETYGKNIYETNFRFIFLLLYQNMPNRLNRLALRPPVIYRSKLPGVFSYRYSYLNQVSVKMHGVRKNKTITNFITTEGNKDITTVIPEGYEVTLSLKSLLPETQNLFFDAVNNPVFSSEESPAAGIQPEINAIAAASNLGPNPFSLEPEHAEWLGIDK